MRIGAHVLLCRFGFVKREGAVDRQLQVARRHRNEQVGVHSTSLGFDTGRVGIVIISNQQEPNDYACFTWVGIDPEAWRFLMLKSRVHWRAGFAPVTRAIIECAGVGVCTSDYATLDFRRVRRPIFPLDPI